MLSTPEIQKCGDMAVAFSRQRLKPEIQCVSAESPQQCMERIQVGAGSRGQIRPGGQAVAVPGMVLTGPPSAYLVWRIQGSLSRRKSPMTIPQREGRRKLPQEAATTPWRGVGERQGEGGYFPWGSLRDSSLLSRWARSRRTMGLAQLGTNDPVALVKSFSLS